MMSTLRSKTRASLAVTISSILIHATISSAQFPDGVPPKAPMSDPLSAQTLFVVEMDSGMAVATNGQVW